MSSQKKKERQRLKRKRKQQELRKQRNVSVYQKLSGQEGKIECFINANWKESGLANVIVVRGVHGGTNLFAAYLIDIWCSGLKDAFSKPDFTHLDLDDELKRRSEGGMPMVAIDAAAARRLVAGSMRMAVQNGFRLPAKAARYASVVGATNYVDPDLSDFEMPDGKYRYVGSIAELRRRLVGPVDEFLRRPDVEVLLNSEPEDSDADVYDEEDEFDEDERVDPEQLRSHMEAVRHVRQRGTEAVSDWLIANGGKPHPRLSEAVLIVFTELAARRRAEETGEEQDDQWLEDTIEDEKNPDELKAAIDQVIAYIRSRNTAARVRDLSGQEEEIEQPEQYRIIATPKVSDT